MGLLKIFTTTTTTTTQCHLCSLSACHISINNLPSAVGCLCVSSALTDLSVTGTGCSSSEAVGASLDSHVKPSQIHANRCRAEDMGNHSNDLAECPSQELKSDPGLCVPSFDTVFIQLETTSLFRFILFQTAHSEPVNVSNFHS